MTHAAPADAKIAANSPTPTRSASEVTDVVTVNVLSGGKLKPEYEVEDVAFGATVDCSEDAGSPVGTTPNTHHCASGALYAVACWIDPGSPISLLCLDRGWSTSVRRLGATGLHATPTPSDPVPLGVELLDGSRWGLRVSGSADPTPEGYYVDYTCMEQCAGYPRHALVGPKGVYAQLDTSAPLWTVKLAQTGYETPLPDPVDVPVRRVWFIAAG